MAELTVAADTAKRLIEKYGRSIVFEKLDRVPAITAEPWNGATDPRATPAATATMFGLTMHPESLVNLGIASPKSELVTRAEAVLMVAPGSTGGTDISDFDEVVDEGRRYRMTKVEKLRPGSLDLLYFVGLER